MGEKKQKQGMTKASIARKLGLDNSAITYAVRRCDLVLNEDGRINPDDERNQAYFRKHKTAIKASGVGGRGKPIVTEDPDEIVGNSVEQGRLLDNQLKKVKIQRERVAYFETIRRVYPREVVARTLSLIRSLIDENFKGFDDRYGFEIWETARELEHREFCLFLYQKIDESMRAVFAGLDRELERIKSAKQLQQDFEA